MASAIKLNRLFPGIMKMARLRAPSIIWNRMNRMNRINAMNRMPRIHQSRVTMYGGIMATAFGASYMISKTQRNWAKCEVDKNIDLLNSVRDLAPVIDAKKMLKLFVKRFNTEGHSHVTEDFVVELFVSCGVDKEIASHLFRLMDWNNNGRLEPAELAATFTLFQVGPDITRYKFLFHCLDLDESKTVDKDEFRAFLTALLEAKYRLSGLRNYKESDELYVDISYDEYRTIAKIKANALVREIFLFADQNRDGELNMKEFLHWCKRGGSQVAVLKDILHHIVDDAMSHQE